MPLFNRRKKITKPKRKIMGHLTRAEMETLARFDKDVRNGRKLSPAEKKYFAFLKKKANR